MVNRLIDDIFQCLIGNYYYNQSEVIKITDMECRRVGNIAHSEDIAFVKVRRYDLSGKFLGEGRRRMLDCAENLRLPNFLEVEGLK